MKYPGYDYAFEIGQRVVIVARPDVDFGAEGVVKSYSYYPETILYELRIPDGYSGRWFWKEPKFRYRSFQKEQIRDAAEYQKMLANIPPYITT